MLDNLSDVRQKVKGDPIIMKKISTLLALVMVLALAVPVVAAEGKVDVSGKTEVEMKEVQTDADEYANSVFAGEDTVEDEEDSTEDTFDVNQTLTIDAAGLNDTVTVLSINKDMELTAYEVVVDKMDSENYKVTVSDSNAIVEGGNTTTIGDTLKYETSVAGFDVAASISQEEGTTEDAENGYVEDGADLGTPELFEKAEDGDDNQYKYLTDDVDVTVDETTYTVESDVYPEGEDIGDVAWDDLEDAAGDDQILTVYQPVTDINADNLEVKEVEIEGESYNENIAGYEIEDGEDVYVMDVEASTTVAEMAEVAANVVRTQDFDGVVGDGFRTKVGLDVEVTPVEMVTANAEYAQNMWNGVDKEDSEGARMKFGATVTPVKGAEATATYEKVEEAYSSAADLDPVEKYKATASYEAAVPFTPEASLTYSNKTDLDSYDQSAEGEEGKAEDDVTTVMDLGLDVEEDVWNAGFTYKTEDEVNETDEGVNWVDGDTLETPRMDETTTTIDLNGAVTALETDALAVDVNGGYKTVTTEDNTKDENPVTDDETIMTAGLSGDYTLVFAPYREVTLSAGYDVEKRDYTTDSLEDKDAATLNTVKLGSDFTVNSSTTWTVDYTYTDYVNDLKEEEADYYGDEFTTNSIETKVTVKF